jgi:hypothetical protein
MLPPISCLEPNELNKKNTPKRGAKEHFHITRVVLTLLQVIHNFRKEEYT